jgi:hypothetical protein
MNSTTLTRAQFIKGNARYRSITAGNVDLQMKAIRKAVTEGVEFLLACRVLPDFDVNDTAKHLHDAVSKAVAECNAELDAVDLHPVDAIDLTELLQLITEREH